MFLVGHAGNADGGTGVTVLLFPSGAVMGCDVRGGAPGTRETDLLDPLCFMEKANALVLTGGSAYGLAAADGVMRFCEGRGWGFDTGFGTVPIVPAACLFDLAVGDPKARPDAGMGYGACENAGPLEGSPMGNVGAGTGATVGKYAGPERAMKSGLGWFTSQAAGIRVSAIVAVNALGGILDERANLIAGAMAPDGSMLSPVERLLEGPPQASWGSNTTLAAVVTNAALTKAQCGRAALVSHDGFADAIWPVHTRFDGDTVFFASTGEREVDPLVVEAMARIAVAGAIREGVKSAATAYGHRGLGGTR